MTERAYTVSEIDELRRVCDTRWFSGTTYYHPRLATYYGRSYKESDRTAEVEGQVRTYMMAGILGRDILEADTARGEAYIARLEAQDEQRKQQKLSEPPSPGEEPHTPSIVQSVDFSLPPPVTNEPVEIESNSATGVTTGWWEKIRAVFRAAEV